AAFIPFAGENHGTGSPIQLKTEGLPRKVGILDFGAALSLSVMNKPCPERRAAVFVSFSLSSFHHHQSQGHSEAWPRKISMIKAAVHNLTPLTPASPLTSAGAVLDWASSGSLVRSDKRLF